MEESKPTGAELVPSERSLVVRRNKINRKPHEDDFVPKIRVKLVNGDYLPVPLDANANRNASIMLAELARNFVKDQLEKYQEKSRPMTPAEIKDLVTAIKAVNEMTIVAHEDIFLPSKPMKAEGEATKGMLKAVEAAARGMASGNAEAQNNAVKQFLEMVDVSRK